MYYYSNQNEDGTITFLHGKTQNGGFIRKIASASPSLYEGEADFSAQMSWQRNY
jgi:hypothetical protein